MSQSALRRNTEQGVSKSVFPAPSRQAFFPSKYSDRYKIGQELIQVEQTERKIES